MTERLQLKVFESSVVYNSVTVGPILKRNVCLDGFEYSDWLFKIFNQSKCLKISMA